MEETAQVVGVDVVDEESIVVDLSDGRTLGFTLVQLLSLEPVSVAINDELNLVSQRL